MKNRMISVFLFFVLTMNGLIAQNTPWDIAYCLNGGENKSVGISKLPIANPIEKPGWNLIFNDEFKSDSLNHTNWNRSTFLDDQPASCNRGFAVNPVNTSVENGYARINNTIDEHLPGCPYSFGEIKTMSILDTNFRSYYFYAPGYLETRVKLYNKTGQGAACWLWGVGTPENPGTPGPWNEIDVFELNGLNGNIFNGAYHWTSNGNHVSQHQAIYLTDSSQLYDLSANWTTFGLEWDSTAIRWFVNNLLVKELDLTRVPPYCVQAPKYTQPLAPFCLRLNSGVNSVGNQAGMADPADFPQAMLVDYVRIYKKKGHKVSPITTNDGIAQICSTATSPSTSDKTISSHYYPGTVTTLSSPAFEIHDVHVAIPQPPEKKLIWIKSGVTPGQTYPIYAESVFPGNYAEKDTLDIYIATDAPLLSSGNFIGKQVDTSCRFTVTSNISGNISGFDFSLDGGSTWNAGTVTYNGLNTTCTFGEFRPNQVVNFGMRLQNGCGTSPSGNYSLTMPSPPTGCTWPAGNDDPGIANTKNTAFITLAPNPFTSFLQLTLSSFINPAKSRIRVTIYDIHGREITSMTLNHREVTLNLQQLAPGVYYLMVTGNDNFIFRSPVVKRL